MTGGKAFNTRQHAETCSMRQATCCHLSNATKSHATCCLLLNQWNRTKPVQQCSMLHVAKMLPQWNIALPKISNVFSQAQNKELPVDRNIQPRMKGMHNWFRGAGSSSTDYNRSINKRQIERGRIKLLRSQMSRAYEFTFCCSAYNIFARYMFKMKEIYI